MTSPLPMFIACDHAAYALKEKILAHLPFKDIVWKDLGCFSEERVDYPSYADAMAKALHMDPSQLGLLLCGSGQGMNIRVNKYPFIRGALCWNLESVQWAREHNHANVLCLGARFLKESLCFEMIEAFIKTPCSSEKRHCRRVQSLTAPLC